jgi:YqaJ-like viral recombinase domain
MNRIGFIGGSDAKRILDGEWLDLYHEKIGAKEPENLHANFPVQLGVHTERFHLDWLQKFHGFELGRHGTIFRMKGYDHLRAQIDAWCSMHLTFVETKHTNGRATRESMIEWYQPQMAHYCNVLDRPFGMLSFIAGNSPPEWFSMEPSVAYRNALLDMEQAFWWHVEHREAPAVIPPSAVEAARTAKAAAGEVKIDNMRIVDMTSNNQWATLALDYIVNKASATAFEAAKKALKDLVEADVREAFGHGIRIKRSKSGSLTFSGE